MNDRGSVFIETIIAAAILAGILGVAFDTLRDSAARVRRVRLQEQAMLVAQSRLAEYPLTQAVRADRLTGSVPGFRWTVDIAPGRGDGEKGLMRVTAVVSDGASVRVSLASLRPGVAR